MNIVQSLSNETPSQYCSLDSNLYNVTECMRWQDTTLVKQCFDMRGHVIKCDFLFSETGIDIRPIVYQMQITSDTLKKSRTSI